jgi:hypothetical protein
MAKARKRRFVYRAATAEQLRRRHLKLRWREILYRAYKGETEELCEYLRSVPLEEQQQEALAEWIERRTSRRNARGRKPGRRPSPHEVTLQDVVGMARRQLRWIRMRSGGARVPRGSYAEAINDVLRVLAEEEGHHLDHINRDQVLKVLRRGRR